MLITALIVVLIVASFCAGVSIGIMWMVVKQAKVVMREREEKE